MSAISVDRFSQRIERGGFRANQAVFTAVGALDTNVASNRDAILSSAARIVDLFDEPKPSKDLVLEALAASYGYRDWNTFSGTLKRQEAAQMEAASEDDDDDELELRGFEVSHVESEYPTTRRPWLTGPRRTDPVSGPIDHFPQLSRKRPPKVHSRTFHVVQIGDWIFHGFLSADGPYIVCWDKTSKYGAPGCALGVSDLHWFNPVFQGKGEGWYLVKYGNQASVKLTGMDDAMILRLADEFGFALKYHCPDGHTGFFNSPAWHGLKEFVAKHPRMAKNYAMTSEYLRSWYERAVDENASAAG